MAIRGLLHRIRVLIAPTSYAREVDAEIRFHLDLEAMQQRADGAGPDDAEWAARRRFGNVTHQRDEVRRMSGIEALDRLKQDIGYAVRGIRRSPGFAAAVAITLALAVGANAAVFSVIDPLFFRPPPGVVDPGSVRRLYANHPNATYAIDGRAIGDRFSYPEFLSIRASLTGVARVAAYNEPRDSVRVTHNGDSLFASVTYATADFVSMLAARASRGRLFVPQDDDVNSPASVAVVSQRFSRRAFVDTDAVGQTISVDETRFLIIGVAPDGFEGIDWSSSDIWLPFSMRPRFGGGRDLPWYASQDRYLQLVARVGTQVDDRQLESRASLGYVRAGQFKSKSEQGRSVVVGPVLSALGPEQRQQELSISVALAAVAAILFVVACANVANLLLARAILRRREIAVRLALGVSRARLASQLIAETAVLAVFAGFAALIFATWAGGALRLALLPRITWIEQPVGPRVALFAAGVTIGAALLAAAVPSMLASRLDLTDALRGGAREGSVQRTRVRAVLLVLQGALSVMLLIGASLFARSLRNVHAIDLGLDSRDLIVADVSFPDQKAHQETRALVPQVAERIAALPGVGGVSYGYGAPFNMRFSGVELYSSDRDSVMTKPGREAEYIAVSPNYFSISGTRIVAGRPFLASDQQGALPVMVVSTAMAQAIWPRQNPLGKCIVPDDPKNPCYTVVGVAEDAHAFRIIEDKTIAFYLPIAQTRYSARSLVVRVGSGEAAAITPIVRRELTRAFPAAQASVLAVDDILGPQLRPWRLGAQLFSALSLLALLVAAIGIHSVTAFHAYQRTHEMGVRLALGARTGDILRLVVGTGVRTVAIGVVVGLAGALAAGKLLSSLLYGVSPRDPASMALAAAGLLVIGTLASAWPAWRASHVDPVVALRDE